MAHSKLKKDDPVVIRTGRRGDRGKVSKVLRVMRAEDKVTIEKLNIVKEFVRPNPQKNIKGGIVEREGAVKTSKVMYYCRECEQGVRIGVKVTDDGKKRVCKKCGTLLD
jgi:large subunit ribosomal protein L24